MRSLILLVALAACRSPDEVRAIDASSIDAALPADADPKIAPCADHFGTELTSAFGRIDGTVYAVVPPNYQACAMPNRTHLILQVLMHGAVYRMVVNVLSDQGSPDVFYRTLDAPLAGAPWSDGWHPTEQLDYVTNLDIHSDSFVATPQAELVKTITDQLELGAPISVYATSGSTPSDSAHLVHRNQTNRDGAIVLHPDAAPTYLLFHFDEQVF